MYIMINDIKHSKVKRELTYLIQLPQTRKSQLLSCIAIILRCCYVNRSIAVLSVTGKEIVEYTDKELNSLIGTKLKSQMLDSCNDILRTNKLERITKMIISLNELDNSDNLEDGRPSNVFIYLLCDKFLMLYAF